MRAVLLFLLLSVSLSFAGTAMADDLGHNDVPIIFDPAVPTLGHFERLNRLEFRDQVLDPNTDELIRACVIVLDQIPAEPGEVRPLDDVGQPKILLDDGMTLLSTQELKDEVDEETCRFYEYGQHLAGRSLFYDRVIG